MTINLGRPATTPCPSGETSFCIIHSTFTPLLCLTLSTSADLCQFVSTPFKSEQNPEPLKLQTIGSQIIRNHFAKKNLYSGGLIFTSYLPGDGPLHRSLLTPRAHRETSCQCCRHRKERMMLFVLRVFMPSKTTDS